MVRYTATSLPQPGTDTVHSLEMGPSLTKLSDLMPVELPLHLSRTCHMMQSNLSVCQSAAPRADAVMLTRTFATGVSITNWKS